MLKFVKLVKCITVPICFKKRASEEGIYRNIKNSLCLKTRLPNLLSWKISTI